MVLNMYAFILADSSPFKVVEIYGYQEIARLTTVRLGVESWVRPQTAGFPFYFGEARLREIKESYY